MSKQDKLSQFDPGQVLKDVHDFEGGFLRTSDVRSVVPSYYSHFSATYNSSNQPTNVIYYRGTKQQYTTVITEDDVSSSLNNKYFYIFSNPDNRKYHIWFNVNNAGTDPSPSNSTPIEINIAENDSNFTVAIAIRLVINSLFKDVFYASNQGAVVELKTIKEGVVNPSMDVNTGFDLVSTPGEQVIVSSIVIDYVGNSPVYNGQELKGYSYDIYSGKFIQKTDINLDNLTVNVDLDGFSTSTSDSIQLVGSINGLPTGEKYGYVNNIRQQILASHDRESTITYADFGTKNQRVIEIRYTSATFPSFQAVKTLSYTLVGNRYKRTNITWTIE
jgi:hypothetical protein